MAVEHLPFGVLIGTTPMISVQARAFLPCGCSMVVGHRLDTLEVATGAIACSCEHHHLVNHATLLLRSSLVEPADRSLVEVCDELLGQAAQAHGVAA